MAGIAIAVAALLFDLEDRARARETAEVAVLNQINDLLGRPPGTHGLTITTSLDYLRRERQTLADLELFRSQLDGLNLPGLNLAGTNLREVNLSRSVLTGANLSGALLIEADLSMAFLWRADLSGAILWEAVLIEAHLLDADLSGAQLVGAILGGSDLGGADLSGADLSGANLAAVKNLNQAQLDSACAREHRPPLALSEGLEWRSGPCSYD